MANELHLWVYHPFKKFMFFFFFQINFTLNHNSKARFLHTVIYTLQFSLINSKMKNKMIIIMFVLIFFSKHDNTHFSYNRTKFYYQEVWYYVISCQSRAEGLLTGLWWLMSDGLQRKLKLRQSAEQLDRVLPLCCAVLNCIWIHTTTARFVFMSRHNVF
jgi:hypothetical protein